MGKCKYCGKEGPWVRICTSCYTDLHESREELMDDREEGCDDEERENDE